MRGLWKPVGVLGALATAFAIGYVYGIQSERSEREDREAHEPEVETPRSKPQDLIVAGWKQIRPYAGQWHKAGEHGEFSLEEAWMIEYGGVQPQDRP